MRYNRLFLSSMIIALLPFGTIAIGAAPKSGVEIQWSKGVSLSGTYILSSLVNRKMKTWGWANENWASMPVFSGFEIKKDGSRYLFAGGNLHEEVVWFQIHGTTLEGNPCAPFGNFCISRIRVIDSDTFAILENGKESTYYRVDGMTLIYPEEDAP